MMAGIALSFALKNPSLKDSGSIGSNTSLLLLAPPGNSPEVAPFLVWDRGASVEHQDHRKHAEKAERRREQSAGLAYVHPLMHLPPLI